MATPRVRGWRLSSVARLMPRHAESGIESSGLTVFPIVGVGASAGGLDALRRFLACLPGDVDMAFVLIQHRDRAHKSELVPLLAGHCCLPVVEAIAGQVISANHVYVVPADKLASLAKGTLVLSDRPTGVQHGIDHFFSSLADSQGARALGVVLSGAANDGTAGLGAIKDARGMTFVQDDSAAVGSMPKSATVAGHADFVMEPEAIAATIARIARRPAVAPDPPQVSSQPGARPDEDSQEVRGPMDEALARIHAHLRAEAGIDLAAYKSTTIGRRLARRMALRKVRRLAAYADLLDSDARERQALLHDILIHVTRFFRDAESFAMAHAQGFGPLLDNDDPHPLRIWVAGCATGEEAYSLAMALVEQRCGGASRDFEIFATDANEPLLVTARAGYYEENAMRGVSRERRERFFHPDGRGWRVNRDVRDKIVFARHNLLQDPFFSRIDFVSCRNVLIYLQPPHQERILRAFHAALNPGGRLWLGASEPIGRHSYLFTPLDKARRLYASTATESKTALARSCPGVARGPRAAPSPNNPPAHSSIVQRAAHAIVAQWGPAVVLIAPDLRILAVFGAEARTYVDWPQTRGTLPDHILDRVKESLVAPLRKVLDEARQSGHGAIAEGYIPMNGADTRIILQAEPLRHEGLSCHLVSFLAPAPQTAAAPAKTGSTLPQRISHERSMAGTPSGTDLESALIQAHRSLDGTHGRIADLTRDLEFLSEQAQCREEELQTTLEELETTNEELESTNEELSTLNEELAARNHALKLLNDDLNNLEVSIELPLLILNHDLTVRRCTAAAQRVFQIAATDIGRPLSAIAGIRHTLPAVDMAPLAAAAIDDGCVVEREVRDHGGRWYLAQARPYRHDGVTDGAVLMLADIDTVKRIHQEIEQAKGYAEAILRTARVPLVILRADLRIDTANAAFYETFHIPEASVVNQSLFDINHGAWNGAVLRGLLNGVLAQATAFDDFRVSYDLPGRGNRTLSVNGRKLLGGESGTPMIVMSIEDITDRVLRDTERQFRLIAEALPIMVWMSGPHPTASYFNRRWLSFTGRPAADEAGHGWLDGIHPEDRKECEALYLRAYDRHREFHSECRLRRHDGQYRHVVLMGYPHFSPENMFLGMIGSAVDITERQRMEADMAKASKLESLGVLAGGFAHDFNNLLTAILSNLYLAKLAIPGHDEPLKLLSDAEQACFASQQLTQQLLTFARGGSPVKTLLDLGRALEGWVQFPLRGSNVRPVCIIPEGLWCVEADEGQMRQVISNLVINAQQAMPEGGRLTVVCENLTMPNLDPAVPRRDTDYVRIALTDEGPGIPEEHLPKIFDPFYTTKAKGSGLGLTTSYRVIQKHGGHLTVQSPPGGGATFLVYLPASRALPVKADTSTPPVAAGTGRLLVMDDEASIRGLTQALLARLGYEVDCAENGQTAVAAYRQAFRDGRPYDGVILDLTVRGGMGGKEALLELRAIDPNARVIVASGYANDPIIADFAAYGFNGRIVKPFRLEDLRQAALLLTAAQVQ